MRKQLEQLWPVTLGSGHLFVVDHIHAVFPECVELAVKILLFCGRNFKQYGKNLRLFKELCQIYRNDEAVDFSLCWYGLDQVTVLGEFWREHVSDGWEYAGSEREYPFIPTVGEMVEDALFSCFSNGFEDNVVLMDSDISPYVLLIPPG